MTINLNLPVGSAVVAHTVLVAADLHLRTSVVPTCFTTVYNKCPRTRTATKHQRRMVYSNLNN